MPSFGRFFAGEEEEMVSAAVPRLRRAAARAVVARKPLRGSFIFRRPWDTLPRTPFPRPLPADGRGRTFASLAVKSAQFINSCNVRLSLAQLTNGNASFWEAKSFRV